MTPRRPQGASDRAFRLQASVGRGRPNRPDDLRQIRSALTDLGHLVGGGIPRMAAKGTTTTCIGR